MGILRKIFNKDTTTDVVDLLTAQHSEVDDLMKRLEEGGGDKRALFAELADNLAAHATIEEKIFYPAMMTKATKDLLQESVEEHLSMKRLLADLLGLAPDTAAFKAKLAVLKEQVSHHAHSEEEKKLFPEVRALFSADERAAIGNECLAMFEQLMTSSPRNNLPNEIKQAAPLPSAPRA